MLVSHKRAPSPFVAVCTIIAVLSLLFFTATAVSLRANGDINSSSFFLQFSNFEPPVGSFRFTVKFYPPTLAANPELPQHFIYSFSNHIYLLSRTHPDMSYLTTGPSQGDPTYTCTFQTFSPTSSLDVVRFDFSMFFQTKVSIEVYQEGSATPVYQWSPNYVFTPNLSSLYPSVSYAHGPSIATIQLSRLPGLDLNDLKFLIVFETSEDIGSSVGSVTCPNFTVTQTPAFNSVAAHIQLTPVPNTTPTLPLTLTVPLTLTSIAKINPITFIIVEEPGLNRLPTLNRFDVTLPTFVIDENGTTQSSRIKVISYHNLDKLYSNSDSIWLKTALQYRPTSTTETLHVLPHPTIQAESHIFFCEFVGAVGASIINSHHGSFQFLLNTPSALLGEDLTIECFSAVSSLFNFLNGLDSSSTWDSVGYIPFATAFAVSQLSSQEFVNSEFSDFATNNPFTNPSQLSTVASEIQAVTDAPLLLSDNFVYERYTHRVKLPGYSWSVGVEFELPLEAKPASLDKNERLAGSANTFKASASYWTANPTNRVLSSTIGEPVPSDTMAITATTPAVQDIISVSGGTVPTPIQPAIADLTTVAIDCIFTSITATARKFLCRVGNRHSLDLTIETVFYHPISTTTTNLSFGFTVTKMHHRNADILVKLKSGLTSWVPPANYVNRYPTAFGFPIMPSSGQPETVDLALTHVGSPFVQPPTQSTYEIISPQLITFTFSGAYTSPDSYTLVCYTSEGVSSGFTESAQPTTFVTLPFVSSTTAYYCLATYTTKLSGSESGTPVVTHFITSWFKIAQSCNKPSFIIHEDDSVTTTWSQECFNGGSCNTSTGACSCSPAFYGTLCEHTFPTITDQSTWPLSKTSVPLNQQIPAGFNAVLVAPNNKEFPQSGAVFPINIPSVFGINANHPTFTDTMRLYIKIVSQVDSSLSFSAQAIDVNVLNDCSANGLTCSATGSDSCNKIGNDYMCLCKTKWLGVQCFVPALSDSAIVLGQGYLNFQDTTIEFPGVLPTLTINDVAGTAMTLEFDVAQNGFPLANLWDKIPVNSSHYEQTKRAVLTVHSDSVQFDLSFIDKCDAECDETGTAQCTGKCLCNLGYYGNLCQHPYPTVDTNIYLGQQYLTLPTHLPTDYQFRLTIAYDFQIKHFDPEDSNPNQFDISRLYAELSLDEDARNFSQTISVAIVAAPIANPTAATSHSNLGKLVDRCTYLALYMEPAESRLSCNLQGTSSCWVKESHSGPGCMCNAGFTGYLCENPSGADMTYDEDERIMDITWASPQTSLGQNTIFLRVAMLAKAVDVDDHEFNSDEVVWTTASYIVSNQFVSINGESTEVSDAFWIPDFLGRASINIPPLPTFSGISIFLVPEGSTTPLFTFTAESEIKSVCTVDAEKCASPCNQSDYYSTGCAPDLTSNAVGACPALTCPPAMVVDLRTCSCQCTSSTCLANTRVAMLYFTDAEFVSGFESTRFRSYVSRTMKTELALALGLNSLPPPLPTTTATSPANRLRGYVNQDDVPNSSAPVGLEQLHLIPVTYTSLKFSALTAYITIQPHTPTTPTAVLEARWDTIQKRLKRALHTSNIFQTTNDRLLYSLSPPLANDNTIPAHNAQLIKLSTTPQLSVRCLNPTNSAIKASCPSVSSIYSPFWSTCSENARHLTVECVDFAGIAFKSYDTCSFPFYPGYPKQTSVYGCESPINYSDADISSFTMVPTTLPIQAGSGGVLFTWSYPDDANPTYTVDIFVRRAFPMVLLDIDYNDNDQYQDEMTVQQSMSAGYRVLLGTYPATDLTAFAAIPETISSDGSESILFANFIIRVTQQAKRAESSRVTDAVQIIPKNLCAAVVCGDKAICAKGKCVCGPGLKFDANGNCVPICTGLCKNNRTCLVEGVCDCGESFSGPYCEIDKGCVDQNRKLCKNRGSVLFNSATNTCGSECSCFSTNRWTFDPTPIVTSGGTAITPTPNSNCNKCDLLDFSNQLCDQTGTSLTRTTTMGCTKCECSYGFSGDKCEFRVAYGTISFTPPSSGPFTIQAAPLQASTTTTTVTGTPLELDEDTTTILLRDMALSLNVPVSSLTLKQAIQITSTPTNGMDVLQSPTRNAITFEFQQTQDATMNNLYDLWGDVQKNFDSTPIGQTDASAVGTPSGAEAAFDPQCDTTVAGNNCPTGSNPLVADTVVDDGEDSEPLIPEVSSRNTSSMTTSTIIAIVVPIGVAVVIIVGAIVIVACMKKHQKGCFAPNKDDSNNDHLELESYSEASAATTTRSHKSKSKPAKSASKPTTFSSGTSTSVDLIECDLDDNEDVLPSGWKKMKHTATGQVLYINDDKMVSQKTHPSHAETLSGW